MPEVVNNRETAENDKVHYINHLGQIYDAVIKRITHHDGNHHADLDVDKDGQTETVEDVPHNTSPEKHSWNHTVPTETEVPVEPDTSA